LGEDGAPACCAVMALAGNRLLLGFNRVLGLRTPEYLRRHRRDHRVFNPATAISEELRQIVSGFAISRGSAEHSAADRHGGLRQYLSFVVDKQSYALPVEAVDRVVPAQPLVVLPRKGSGQQGITGAIELRGQVVPVTSVDPSAGEARAYVIMNGNAGPMAIGVERIDRLVALRPEQIAPTRGDEGLIDSVGVLGEDRDVLRILAPERIGGSV
jgi:chemotaxis signal transduction protein